MTESGGPTAGLYLLHYHFHASRPQTAGDSLRRAGILQFLPSRSRDANGCYARGDRHVYAADDSRLLAVLQETADRHHGLDYLQVFQDIDKPENLWFIQDSAITALLPSDY